MKEYKYVVEFYLNNELRLTRRTNTFENIDKIIGKETHTGKDLNDFGFNCRIKINGKSYTEFMFGY